MPEMLCYDPCDSREETKNNDTYFPNTGFSCFEM